MDNIYLFQDIMHKTLVLLLWSGILLLSWCGSSASVEYNDELPATPRESVEETSEPTIVTEIPSTVSEEIVTQPDTSL